MTKSRESRWRTTKREATVSREETPRNSAEPRRLEISLEWKRGSRETKEKVGRSSLENDESLNGEPRTGKSRCSRSLDRKHVSRHQRPRPSRFPNSERERDCFFFRWMRLDSLSVGQRAVGRRVMIEALHHSLPFVLDQESTVRNHWASELCRYANEFLTFLPNASETLLAEVFCRFGQIACTAVLG